MSKNKPKLKEYDVYRNGTHHTTVKAYSKKEARQKVEANLGDKYYIE